VNVLRCSNDSICSLYHVSDATKYVECLFSAKYLEQHNSVASLIHNHVCEYISSCNKPCLH